VPRSLPERSGARRGGTAIRPCSLESNLGPEGSGGSHAAALPFAVPPSSVVRLLPRVEQSHARVESVQHQQRQTHLKIIFLVYVRITLCDNLCLSAGFVTENIYATAKLKKAVVSGLFLHHKTFLILLQKFYKLKNSCLIRFRVKKFDILYMCANLGVYEVNIKFNKIKKFNPFINSSINSLHLLSNIDFLFLEN